MCNSIIKCHMPSYTWYFSNFFRPPSLRGRFRSEGGRYTSGCRLRRWRRTHQWCGHKQYGPYSWITRIATSLSTSSIITNGSIVTFHKVDPVRLVAHAPNSASESTVALCWSQTQVEGEGWWRGADTVTVTNRRMKSNGKWRRVNGKHRDMEDEGKGDGHQHGKKPRIPEPVLIVGKLT